MKKFILIITILIIVISTVIYFFKYKNTGIFIRPNDMANMIVVTSPIKDNQISSPLSIVGRARGEWYFEGSFPVTLVDLYGNTIASGNVTSQGEWMTKEFVPFLGTLRFNNFIKNSKGKLILKKDNPSGDISKDLSIEIPIIFK